MMEEEQAAANASSSAKTSTEKRMAKERLRMDSNVIRINPQSTMKGTGGPVAMTGSSTVATGPKEIFKIGKK